jgi:hypothetical protein
MLGRMASRVLTSFALLCATLAWAGWVFLNTIGDPARSEKIATAVLEDEASSEQIASSFALQFVRASGIDRSNIDLVEGAIAAALDDPRITTDVIDAFGAAHANALGVEDTRSTTIDANAMVAAVRDRLAVVSPEIAAQLPDGVLPEITLPKYHPPGISSLRSAADAATSLLAIVAGLLVVVAFAFGDRRGVLRRVGIWGVCSGVAWTLVPLAIVGAARAWASDVDKIVEAAMRESTSGVMPVAIALVVGGVVAVVVSFVPNLWPETDQVQRRGSVVQGSPAPRSPSYAPVINPAAHPSAHGVGSPTTARVDTYVPSAHTRPPQDSPWAPSAPPPPAAQPSAAQPSAARPSAQPPAPIPAATDEIDPWSTYFGPTTKP